MRDVRVEDRHPGAVEPVADLLRPCSAPRSFSSRIRSKTSTLASTAMPIVSARPARPGQREGRLHEGHRADQQDHVQDQGDDRDDAGEPVVDDHEDRHDEHRDPDGADALGDRVLAEGRPDLLLLQRGRVRALAGRLPAWRMLDQVLDLLGLEALAAPSMIPWSRISELIDGADMTQVVEQDRELVLERAALLGQVLAGQLAELPRRRPVEAKPTAGWSRSSVRASRRARGTCR